MTGWSHCSISHRPSKLLTFLPRISLRRPSLTWDIWLGWVKDGNFLLYRFRSNPISIIEGRFFPCGFPSFLDSHGQIKIEISDYVLEVTWAIVAKAFIILWAYLVVRTQSIISTLVTLISQFIAFLSFNTLWGGLAVLRWTYAMSSWGSMTQMGNAA